MIVGCPTCGAEVEFRYDDSFVRVCSHCRSAVVRSDRGVETLGRFADLVPVPTALRLFAEGRYGTTGFLLIGMAQLRHAAGGVWQEWYAKLDGGQWAWISEAQGRLYLTFERPDLPVPSIGEAESRGVGTPTALPAGRGSSPVGSIGQLAPGAQVPLAGAMFTVGERGTATYVSAMGEIPYRLVPMSTFQFVDLSDGRGGFATIDYGDGSEPPAIYLGYQVTPQSLGLSGGEASSQVATAVQGARLACPNCNGSLELRAPDQSLRVMCPYCNSLVSVEGGTLSIIARYAKKPSPVIALGSKGRFQDGELTVIGYMTRSAHVDGTWWPFEEYLLYAPNVGFRWLVCSDGHWSYAQPVAVGAVSLGPDVVYDGATFRRFQVAELRVDSVLGEFYWRVEAGERVRSEDYIAPPAMLSRESSASEQTWSLATYLRPREVEAAFGTRLPLIQPIGVAPNQPYPTGLGKVMAIVTVAFVALGVGKCASAPAAEKLNQPFTIPPTSARISPTIDRPSGLPRSGPLSPPPPTTPEAGSDGSASDATGSVLFSTSFRLDGGKNLAFELTANVSNNWMYAVIDLVNEDTGSVVSFEKSIEYYSGYDDGAWTEGSTRETEVLGPVDGGSYVLRVEAQHGGTSPTLLAVVIRQGVFRWRWFWLGLLVLAIPFGLTAWSGWSFNRRRWQNSNVTGSRGLGLSDSVGSGGDDDDD